MKIGRKRGLWKFFDPFWDFTLKIVLGIHDNHLEPKITKCEDPLYSVLISNAVSMYLTFLDKAKLYLESHVWKWTSSAFPVHKWICPRCWLGSYGEIHGRQKVHEGMLFTWAAQPGTYGQLSCLHSFKIYETIIYFKWNIIWGTFWCIKKRYDNFENVLLCKPVWCFTEQ